MKDPETGTGNGDGPPGSEKLRTRLIALIAFLLTVAALRSAYAVAMPLAFAAIIVAALWPVKPRLDRWLPSWLSYAALILLLLILLAAFAAAIYLASAQVVRAFTENRPAFERLYGTVSDWAAQWGMPLGTAGLPRVVALARSMLSGAYSLIVYLGFIGVLVIFGLPEVPAIRRRMRAELNAGDRRQVFDAAEEIGDKIRSYLGVTAMMSLLTGTACGLWSLAIGLELAFVWALLNFLLNFIPIVGNVVGIIPPVLYAVVQYGDATMPLIALAGFTVIQIGISNFIYPLAQGHSLSLSPLAIVVSLSFWGWLWGIAGALIAVPLTATLVIVCERIPRAIWVSNLLTR